MEERLTERNGANVADFLSSAAFMPTGASLKASNTVQDASRSISIEGHPEIRIATLDGEWSSNVEIFEDGVPCVRLSGGSGVGSLCGMIGLTVIIQTNVYARELDWMRNEFVGDKRFFFESVSPDARQVIWEKMHKD
jgi:hypothetical protein